MSGIRENLEKLCVALIRLAVTRLPPDVESALRNAWRREISETAKRQFEAMFKAVEVSERELIPICQDTGLMTFHVKVGKDYPLRLELPEILRKAVSRATFEVPLRPNAVDPISRENTGDNTGRLVPWLDLELVEGDSLELTVVPKGFGSEMMARLRCVPAAEGFEAVKRFIISSVLEAGGKPCPPIVLGVGMGGVAETAMRLAKRAIARPVGERHPEERISELEEELLKAINETGIGAMGLGGRTTALDVHVEYAHTHTVGTPVALVFQCWCARRASAIIKPDGSAVCTSHPGVDLWKFT